MDQEPDAALIAASIDTPVAFAAVFDRHYDFVDRYLRRRVGLDVADDLVSETFTTAFRVRASYDLAHSDARPWLLGIATNLVRHQRRAEVGVFEPMSASRPRQPRASTRRWSPRVSTLQPSGLGSLGPCSNPDGDRDALLLLAWADLTYAEIAIALDIPIGTVRSRIHRARRRLRELLDLSGQSLFADTITEVIATDG